TTVLELAIAMGTPSQGKKVPPAVPFQVLKAWIGPPVWLSGGPVDRTYPLGSGMRRSLYVPSGQVDVFAPKLALPCDASTVTPLRGVERSSVTVPVIAAASAAWRSWTTVVAPTRMPLSWRSASEASGSNSAL